MKLVRNLALAASLAALGGCGGGEQEGGLTAEENRRLDNAAETLDASPDSLAAPEDAPLGNGEAASDEAETGELPVTGDDAPANQQ